MSTRVIHVDSRDQAASAGRRGARALKAGELVAFATETVYGLGAVATNASAMARLRKIKSRPKRPFTVHVASQGDVRRYVANIPPAARRLMSRAWPGPVTLLLEVGNQSGSAKHPVGNARLLWPDGVIGLRCPDEPVALAMLKTVKEPVVAPSANPAGQAPPRDAQAVLAALDGRIDMVIDSGPTRLGLSSTIVQFKRDGWEIVRPGPFDQRAIRRFIRRRILFVCTGNTCRSPMAAGLAKVILARREGCTTGELRARGIEVSSAGLFAGAGLGATSEAIGAASDLGADIRHHRSKKLTPELIKSADMIFCMTASHVSGVSRMLPEAADKICRLLPGEDISDPIGGGAAVYRRSAERITDALESCLDKGTL